MRNAEIQELRRAALVHQNVRRLDVLVDDEIAMCILDRIRHGTDQLDSTGDIRTRGGAVHIDRLTFDVLHDNVRTPVLIGPAVQQPCDRRMVQGRQNTPLTFEATNAALVCPAQELQCNALFELIVVAFREIHD